MGQQTPVPPYIIADQIAASYETRYLDDGFDKIPDDVTVLMLAHSAELGPRSQFAIDQFLLGGGEALIFIDHQRLRRPAQFFGQLAPERSNLPILFDHLGVLYDPTKIMTDRLTARKVQPGEGQRPVDYVVWLELKDGNIDQSSPITANVGTLAVASAGHIALADGGAVTMTPLVSTSLGSAELNVDEVKAMRSPETLLRRYEPAKPLVIAARLTAEKITTAFSDGPPAPLLKDGDEPPSARMKATYQSKFSTILTEVDSAA